MRRRLARPRCAAPASPQQARRFGQRPQVWRRGRRRHQAARRPVPGSLLGRRRRRRRREQRDLRVRVREPHGLGSLRRPAQRLLGGVQADHAVIRPKACGLRGAGCVAAALVDRAVVEQHAVAASPLYKRPESAGERGERAAARVRVLCREPGVRDTHHRQAVGPARPAGRDRFARREHRLWRQGLPRRQFAAARREANEPGRVYQHDLA
mmetsp:Transcript_35981/g.119146  ORF Transcript_35981/g.119146 Transcript_35981/m.119146 type:complete len:210 (+) Transcript_35981:307-936(+)